ncbi:MAG: type I restriction-modification system subunit M [Candidatus Corynebacterium faecigallinarum]
MITGELKSRVDAVWNAFWTGGISNPSEVVEQITYLLFIRRLDDLELAKEQQAAFTGGPVVDPRFTGEQQDLRWHVFKDLDPETMFEIVSQEVFPFLQKLGKTGRAEDGAESTYATHMKDARFTIPTANLLAKVVGLVDAIKFTNRDTNGDLYEYLLSKLSSAGVNGQFRTPRHIIDMMVQIMDPHGTDRIVDPACGTAGFLVGASEYIREHHETDLLNTALREHFHHKMFHGYDFDSTMLRIGSMNMLMHGIEDPDIRYRDSLSQGAGDDENDYTLVLANPPFAGSLDYETTSKDLLAVAKTKKTELLFLALFLRLLRPGGRAAVIVPDGVLFGSTKAHKALRQALVDEHKLDAVIKLPSGVFKPYAGVSTAILCFTKTGVGGTDEVWFYDVKADGFSLDDKRSPVEANDLPDVVSRWAEKEGTERERARTEQSFTVPVEEIREQGYDLSINRYKEIEFEEVEHRDPLEILAEIEVLNEQIAQGTAELKEMLK